MRLVDSHVHLQADPFGADVADVIAAARLAGVCRFLVPGWDVRTSEGSLRLAAEPDIDAGAGIHPHVAEQATAEDWARIRELAADPRMRAIGETGLDYDRNFSAREAQLTNLRRHLALGVELGKPVILHCRSAPGARDAQDGLLRELEAAGGPRALLHSFSGPIDYGERALELGLTISFSGLVFRTGEEASAEVARLVPRERLLVETDSPWLSPPGAPRRRNEPQWVSVTAHWLADVRQEDPETLGEGLVGAYDALFAG